MVLQCAGFSRYEGNEQHSDAKLSEQDVDKSSTIFDTGRKSNVKFDTDIEPNPWELEAPNWQEDASHWLPRESKRNN